MRNLTLTTFFLCASFFASFAQVGIGTTNPNAGSILDLTATDKAFMPPRLSTAQRNTIGTPAAGMMIFNTDSTCIEVYRGSSWFNICTGKSSAASLPPVNGLTSSDQVSPINLLAKWTFDTDSKEAVSTATATTTVGVTYASAGKIGNCATFSNGYLLYPKITQISKDTALQSYSISMWVNIAPGGAGILRSLFQINPTTYPDIWGAVSLSLNNNGVAGDTLPLRVDQVQVAGRGPVQATRSSNFGGGTAKWTFITETYNGNATNQTMKLYANGIMIDSAQFNNVDKPETFRIVPGGGPAFVGTPANYVSIGTLAFKDRGNTLGDGYGNLAPNAADRPWAAGSITGQLDDIRLFNKTLTIQEISNLYQLGNQGR